MQGKSIWNRIVFSHTFLSLAVVRSTYPLQLYTHTHTHTHTHTLSSLILSLTPTLSLSHSNSSSHSHFSLDEALKGELISAEHLAMINPYQPNLAACWMFQRAMSVKIGSKPKPELIVGMFYALVLI